MEKCKNNYRHISILQILSKVFERIIHTLINKYLNGKRLLTENQSDFTAKNSFVTALIDVAEDLKSGIENGQLMCLVLLDHSKAFDCANHDTLCKKLQYLYNFSSTAAQIMSN